MSSADLSRIKPLLIDYVAKSSDICELQWDPHVTNLRLLFDPYEPSEKDRSAHYFLQVAAIDTEELVSRSENARALMIFMLLATIFEAQKPEGLSEKTRELIWNFANDQKTIDELNLMEFLVTLEKKVKPEKAKTYVV